MKTSIRKLRARIKELEALVAMAQPPSADYWHLAIIMTWRDEQLRIQRKLDGVAKRMKAKKEQG